MNIRFWNITSMYRYLIHVTDDRSSIASVRLLVSRPLDIGSACVIQRYRWTISNSLPKYTQLHSVHHQSITHFQIMIGGWWQNHRIQIRCRIARVGAELFTRTTARVESSLRERYNKFGSRALQNNLKKTLWDQVSRFFILLGNADIL